MAVVPGSKSLSSRSKFWAFSASWSSDLRALAMVQVFGVQEGMRLGPQIQDKQCQIVQSFCIMY